MEGLALLGVALLLGLIAGAVMGWIALFKLIRLSVRMEQLERRLHSATSPQAVQPQTPETAPPAAASIHPALSPETSPVAQAATNTTTTRARPAASVHSYPESRLTRSIKAHWMVWLGGICVGFAGVLLTKHSIEQGLLRPEARIALGIMIALALHGLAEFLIRKTGRPSDVFAALAGGASIMLYAALLAGLHLYQMFSPGLTFAILILVSLATMLLALRHGPVLAAIGILGAFSVPLLVNTGSNNLLGALIYSLVITVSALLMLRYVFRTWLWIGTLAGAFGWWLLALASGQDLAVPLAIYLVCLTYAAIAIHLWDWCLLVGRGTSKQQHLLGVFRDWTNHHDGRLALFFALTTSLHALAIVCDLPGYHWLFTAAMLPLLFFRIARHNAAFSIFPGLAFFGILVGILVQGWINDSQHPAVLLVLVELAIIFPPLSLWLLRRGVFSGLWASLAYLSPVFLIAVGYLRVEELTTDWRWSLGTAILGAVYMHLVFRQRQRSTDPHHPPVQVLIVVLTLAGHLAFSLALVMMVREATLTLALAVQVISLTWLHRQFSFKALEICAKVVLAIVVARLSLNPWLLTYPTDVHWSLWTYGGALVCCLAANRVALNSMFKQWLTGAAIHLFVLMLIFEVRYQLYDGYVFTASYSFTEAVINTSVWGSLGLVYYWRARLSGQLAAIYRLAAAVLLLLALGNYGAVVVLLQNPLFTTTPISTVPIVNILLLAYGAPVLLFAAAYRLLENPYRKLAGIFAGLALLLFCTLEIRHLWRGDLSLGGMSDGELYTYSMVWLLLAIIGSIWAIRFAHANLYKGSMGLLIVVIAKIFLVDMDGLTGLLRAASFMGLGLSLLGLAYLHQQFKAAEVEASGTSVGDR